MSDTFVTLQIANGVARIIIDAPPLNILTRDVLRGFRAALRDADADATVRVLLLSARGKHFSAGASVEEHLPPVFEPMLTEFGETIVELDSFRLPVVAVVQGRCLGGAFELVQAADLIVAADNALFGQPEIELGVFAPVACSLLPRRIGPARAAELLFTGDAISAPQLAAAGMVARVVPLDELDTQASALAERIAAHSRAALLVLKQAVRGARTSDAVSGVEYATDLYINDLMRTRDALEGLHAFVEKRSPVWSHQ